MIVGTGLDWGGAVAGAGATAKDFQNQPGAVNNLRAKGLFKIALLNRSDRAVNQDQFNFGFAVDWMRKDLGLVFDEAKRNGAVLPVTMLVDQFYGDVQKLGGKRWDTSSLIKRLR